MRLGRKAKSKKAKEITILDLGAGKHPEWLDRIARRHPERLYEAVDIKKALWGWWRYSKNLRRKRSDALKRLKKLPSNSVAVVRANISLADIFKESFTRAMSQLLEEAKIGPESMKDLADNIQTVKKFEAFPPEFLTEVKRVLKPKGVFVIVTLGSSAFLYQW